MIREKDKDTAWLIAFVSFAILLLTTIVSAMMRKTPSDLPQAVFMATSNLNRAFVLSLASFTRYAASAALVYGIVGIVSWPPGQS